MSNSEFFVNAEVEYRRQRDARTIAASRAGRSRASWLRRLAATDPNLERHTR